MLLTNKPFALLQLLERVRVVAPSTSSYKDYVIKSLGNQLHRLWYLVSHV